MQVRILRRHVEKREDQDHAGAISLSLLPADHFCIRMPIRSVRELFPEMPFLHDLWAAKEGRAAASLFPIRKQRLLFGNASFHRDIVCPGISLLAGGSLKIVEASVLMIDIHSISRFQFGDGGTGFIRL